MKNTVSEKIFEVEVSEKIIAVARKNYTSYNDLILKRLVDILTYQIKESDIFAISALRILAKKIYPGNHISSCTEEQILNFILSADSSTNALMFK